MMNNQIGGQMTETKSHKRICQFAVAIASHTIELSGLELFL